MANRDSMVQPKLEWHLLPDEVMEEVIKVLMHGKEKYGPWNWATPPYFAKHVVFDSLHRHMAAIKRGEQYDDGPGGSGLLHAAHLLCNAVFACYYELHDLWSKSEEDAPVPGGVWMTPTVDAPPAPETIVREKVVDDMEKLKAVEVDIDARIEKFQQEARERAKLPPTKPVFSEDLMESPGIKAIIDQLTKTFEERITKRADVELSTDDYTITEGE